MASRPADNAGKPSARWKFWRRWTGPRTSGQRLAVGMLALFAMILLVVPLFEDPIDSRAPEAKAGVVDFSGYQRIDRPVQLTGQWRMTWFDPPLGKNGPARGFVGVPGQWTGTKLADGRVAPLEKVRTGARALARLEELVVERADGRPCDVAVHHLDSPERAEALAGRLVARLHNSRVIVGEVGAVVGAHVGPGMVAVALSPRPGST